MSVVSAISDRLDAFEADRDLARLPRRLRLDRSAVHVAVLQRLAANRLVSRGASAGALKGKGASALRADVRQRVVVKALVSRHAAGGAKGALAAHVRYLARPGAGRDGERGVFFDAGTEGLDARAITQAWAEDRHHFRFIVSPEHGDRIPNMRAYVREVMGRVSSDLNQPKLQWLAVAHFDTDQPHAHVLVRGRRDSGSMLVIPRLYMGYGFRARATEVAQELLGDLSRDQAERRVWRETTSDRFTRFDRTLLDEAAKHGGTVPDGAGRKGSYAALLRGRLAHLEGLGLARWEKGWFHLAADLEPQLRRLQIGDDIIRTLNERRLQGARDVVELGDRPITGRVVRAGFHDELGAQPFVVVQDLSGREHYARLKLGTQPPQLDRDVSLAPQQGGKVSWRFKARGADNYRN